MKYEDGVTFCYVNRLIVYIIQTAAESMSKICIVFYTILIIIFTFNICLFYNITRNTVIVC